jgi:hypothetical protein
MENNSISEHNINLLQPFLFGVPEKSGGETFLLQYSAMPAGSGKNLCLVKEYLKIISLSIK